MANTSPKPLIILEAGAVIGSAFLLPGEWVQISLQKHQGGIWVLQHSYNNGVTWYDVRGDASDTAYTWDSKSVQTLLGAVGFRYRLMGGIVGAEAVAVVAGRVDVNHFRLVS